jgi:hypothetical protein
VSPASYVLLAHISHQGIHKIYHHHQQPKKNCQTGARTARDNNATAVLIDILRLLTSLTVSPSILPPTVAKPVFGLLIQRSVPISISPFIKGLH